MGRFVPLNTISPESDWIVNSGPPGLSRMLPLNTFVPERFCSVATLLTRLFTFSGALMVMPPAVPLSCKIEVAPAPVLLRNWINEALFKAFGLAIRTAPSLKLVLPVSMFTVPDRELLPLKMTVPGPLLVKPFVPANDMARVAILVTNSAGEVAEPELSVSTLSLLLVIVHVCTPEVSLNFTVPMLREVSRVTSRLAVGLMVLKSAVCPAPEAAMPPFQRLVSLQFASASAAQRPLAETMMVLIVTMAKALCPAGSVTRTVK